MPVSDQTVSLKLQGDASDLKSEVESAGRTMEELAGTADGAAGSIEGVIAGATSAAGEAGQAISGLEGELSSLTDADRQILIEAEIDQAQQDIARIDEQLESTLSDGDRQILIEAEIDQAQQDIARLDEQLEGSLTDQEIAVLVDERAEAVAKIDRLEGELSSLTDADREVSIDADTGQAEQDLARLEGELDGLSDADRSILIEAEIGQAEENIARIDQQLEDTTLDDREIAILVDERNEASSKLEELRSELGELDAASQQAASGSQAAWAQYGDVIMGVGVAATGAGVALEGFNRGQQDTRAVAGRLANALEGETTSSVMGMAAEIHNATTDLDNLVHSMEIGRQQGITSGEALQEYALFWDMVGDATGESDVALAEASSSLRAVGIAAGEEGDALAAFGYISQETTSSVGDLLKFLERTGPQLRDLGLDINDAAALLGILEQEFGMSGRVARTEFRKAVNEANGDLSTMLDTLGVSETQFASYRAEVDRSSQVIERNAEAFAETRTAMQGVQAWLESTAARFSGVTEAASMLSPVLTGAGGGVMALDGLRRMLEHSSVSMAGLQTGAANFGRFLVGPWGIALAGGALALKHFADRANDLEAASQSLEGHLADVAAGSDVLNDAWLRQEMASAGVLETWEALGIDLDTLRGALMGVPEDVATVEGALNSSRGAWESLSDAAHGLSGGLVGNENDVRELHRVLGALGIEIEGMIPLFEEQERQARNNEAATARLTGQAEAYGAELGVATDATGVATDAAGDYESAMDDLEGQIEDTRTAQQRYIDDVRAAEDPVFALDRALQSVEDAQQKYTDAVEEYGAESREAQQASFELMGKLSDLERAAIDGDLSFSAFDDRLEMWVDQGRITAAQADATRDRVRDLTGAAEDYAGNYTATIKAETASSEAAIARVQAALGRIPRFTHTTVVASTDTSGMRSIPGQIERRAEGGPVWPGQPFWVGEEGPELVTFGEAGYVHDATTSAQMAPAMPAGHDGARAGVTFQPVTNIYGDVGRETLAEKRHQDRLMYRQLA